MLRVSHKQAMKCCGHKKSYKHLDTTGTRLNSTQLPSELLHRNHNLSYRERKTRRGNARDRYPQEKDREQESYDHSSVSPQEHRSICQLKERTSLYAFMTWIPNPCS